MLVLAHRGASADAPENTLEAFREAMVQNADGVELDVQRCASGELVVCHDETLERLAGVPWDVRETSYRKLKDVDVGSKLGFGPARIPLLEEVFELLPQKMLINVELKCDTFDDRGLAVETARLILERGEERRVLLSSFNPMCLFRASSVSQKLKRGFLIDPDRNAFLHERVVTPVTSNYSVHPNYKTVTPERVATWKAFGLKVATWTVNDPAVAAKLADLGVDVCITDKPAAIKARLAQA